MNFISVIVLLASVFLALVRGLPAPADETLSEIEFDMANEIDFEPAEPGTRFRRVTCDLLSVSLPIGSLNHAGCAAHCLAKRKGYKGGRCKNGVCHCRK